MDPRDIIDLANLHMGRCLKAARIGMKPHHFEAFQAFMLDEFGFKGFSRHVYVLCNVPPPKDELERHDRTGPEPTDSGKKGGAP
jgi:hypothetical protein